MCTLYRQRNSENLSRLFDARPLQLPFEPRPDVYPKYEAVVVRKEAGERLLECMAWGIVRTMPGKSGKPVQKAVTNVRNVDRPFWELTSAASSPSPDSPSGARRGPGDRPPGRLVVHDRRRGVLRFAGIWRLSKGPRRFAFLTCEPNPLVAPLHPKAMPLILQREDYDRWLGGELADACALAQPFPSQLMRVG